MNRRDFLKAAGAGAASLALLDSGLQAVSAAARNKLNIIFLMTDQQRWDALGVLNPHVKTPNLDRLARAGILFRQAVCQAPMCVPSRNSMMFGLYPSQLGVRTNAGGLCDESKLPALPLPELMRQAGYQTAGFGKTHWGHGKLNPEPPTRGFEVRAEGQPRKSPLYEKGAVMMDDVNPEGLRQYNEETKDYGGGEEGIAGYIGCTSQVPMRNHRDGFIAEQCLKFLDGGVDPGRPLFLYLSFIKPHAGFNVPKEFEDL
jgi:arylsulfatase A-like enzyme